MNYQDVQSSNILKVGHDGENMGVVFKGGGEYHYAGVPREVFDKVVSAESVGKAINAHIKPKFPAKKIEKE